jgi:hypothetical protein
MSRTMARWGANRSVAGPLRTADDRLDSDTALSVDRAKVDVS